MPNRLISSLPVWVWKGKFADWLRILCLLAFGVWLLWPYFTTHLVGGTDAGAYLCNLADSVTQVREGHFPVWVNQTIYGSQGTTFPLRIVPIYQHLGIILDGLTFHQLGFVVLNNLELIGCGLCGMFLLYGGLRLIQPTKGWLCWAIAVIFMSCPGVYGLLVINDMAMSWTAIAFMSLFFYGTIRSVTINDHLGRVLQVLGLGILWWAHALLATWSTLIGGVVYLFGFKSRLQNCRLLLMEGGLAILFLALII